MKHKVTKAIFPVAGQGTRFLPATKSIPKEIMTLVDRPLVQYAIDEAPELERSLRKKGKAELLDHPNPQSARQFCLMENCCGNGSMEAHQYHPPQDSAGGIQFGAI